MARREELARYRAGIEALGPGERADRALEIWMHLSEMLSHEEAEKVHRHYYRHLWSVADRYGRGEERSAATG